MQEHNPQLRMELYFKTLPKLVQESVRQSGIQFESLEQLKSFADSIQKNQ